MVYSLDKFEGALKVTKSEKFAQAPWAPPHAAPQQQS
jgi:hypothetical protein